MEIDKWKNTSDKFIEKLADYKVKCKKCGHTMVLIDRAFAICDWCGTKVYRSKKDEFKDKIKKVIK